MIDKSHLLCELFGLGIFRVEISLKLSHDDHIVGFDHSLKAQAELTLETNQVVEHGDEACVQGRELAEEGAVLC